MPFIWCCCWVYKLQSASCKFVSHKKFWFEPHPSSSFCSKITHLLNPVSVDLLLLLFLHMSKVLSSRWGENLILTYSTKRFSFVNSVVCYIFRFFYLDHMVLPCQLGSTNHIYKLNVLIESVSAYFSYALLPARCQCFWHNALSAKTVPLFRPCPLLPFPPLLPPPPLWGDVTLSLTS